MRKIFVSILAAASVIAGCDLAFAQAKTEKGDPPAAGQQNANDQGLTAPRPDAPPSASEPKGGVKATGQAENPGTTRPSK